MITHRTAKLGLAAAALAAATSLIAVPALSAPPSDAPGRGPAATATASAPLSDAEQADLTFTREEERLAQELYTAFAEKWDIPTFARIASSEQRHADAAGRMLTRYDVPDPSAGATAGKYADPELQELYDDWYARGMTSADEAIAVGIELEKADIADLQKAIEASDNADLDRVFGNLQRASENHLAAFEALARGEAPGNGYCLLDENGEGMGMGGGRGWGMTTSDDTQPGQHRKGWGLR